MHGITALQWLKQISTQAISFCLCKLALQFWWQLALPFAPCPWVCSTRFCSVRSQHTQNRELVILCGCNGHPCFGFPPNNWQGFNSYREFLSNGEVTAIKKPMLQSRISNAFGAIGLSLSFVVTSALGEDPQFCSCGRFADAANAAACKHLFGRGDHLQLF